MRCRQSVLQLSHRQSMSKALVALQQLIRPGLRHVWSRWAHQASHRHKVETALELTGPGQVRQGRHQIFTGRHEVELRIVLTPCEELNLQVDTELLQDQLAIGLAEASGTP